MGVLVVSSGFVRGGKALLDDDANPISPAWDECERNPGASLLISRFLSRPVERHKRKEDFLCCGKHGALGVSVF